jgi:hypothetical protein
MTRKPSTTSAARPREKPSEGIADAAVTEPAKHPEATPPQPQLRRSSHHARRLLTISFLNVLCADFEVHGADAIRVCREEQPQGYLRLLASLLSNEFDAHDNPLKDIPDAELDSLIEFFRGRIAEQGDGGPLGKGEAPAAG